MPEYQGSDHKGCLEHAVSKHQRALLTFSYNLCSQIELARDATQEAYRVLAEKKCCEIENLRAFLITVVRRYIMRVVCDPRKNVPAVSFPETFPDGKASQAANAAAERPTLLALLKTLPENQEKLIRLIYFEGFKPGEAAQHMNIQPAQAHQWHHAALKSLRVELAKDRQLLA
ncbi:MAG: sigma-70 family RNA polymerase sigma factor [Opitutales bacterium]|nr:sigma-70 family RNA polymerase sigma factor [Opitutales bacterium]MCH8539759.1 sigma-70 family RNA polymerase sigma factor [Opitutales bacterium]